MFGVRPTFGNELERKRVDPEILEVSFRDALEELFEVGSPGSQFQSLHVHVTSRQSMSDETEWRVTISPSEVKLYVAIGELIREINPFFDLFVELGTLPPQEVTVSIWTLRSNEPPIIGSVDK